MKKIIITESQANLLGLKKESEDDGMKSVSGVLGSAPQYIAIYSEELPTKENPEIKEPALNLSDISMVILSIISKQDNSNSVKFVKEKGIFSGYVEKSKFDAIRRDLRGLDTSKIINPNVDTSKIIKPNVDTTKKTTSVKKGVGRSIEALENGILIRTSKMLTKITESQYKKLVKAGLIFEGKVKVIKESDDMVEIDDELKKETIELIKYLYRKSDKFSPFWKKHGLTYHQLCDMLEKKGLIVDKDGKYELSKTTGNPQEAIKALETELKSLIGGSKGVEQKLAEVGDYPAGAEYHPNAPMYNKREKQNPKGKFEVIAVNPEIAILKGPEGLYYFDHFDLKPEDLGVMSRNNIDKEVIQNYVNGHQEEVEPINDELKTNLLSVYDKDPQIISALTANSRLGEETNSDRVQQMMAKHFNRTPKETGETPEEKQKRIADKLAAIRKQELELRKKEKESGLEEMTGAASSGAFTAPMGMVTKEMPVDANKLDVPVVYETTAGTSSVGPYDANALPDIDRNGTFKNHKKTKAEDKTQWAGGEFVKFNDCVKLNNKPAGAGCSKGAVDNVVKTIKTKGNINAPSLGKG